MHTLIPIFTTTINQEAINSISAKKLHTILKIKKDFSDWIKAQIERTELIENIDYILLPQKGEQNIGSGGHNAKDYILTLDSAKHIAMMSQSKKAKEVRDYFISVEKKYIAELKEAALPSSNKQMVLTTSMNDYLFKINHKLVEEGIVSKKLTGNELRILSTLIKLHEESSTSYVVMTDEKIGKLSLLSTRAVTSSFKNLDDVHELIQRVFKRNSQGLQERRITVATKLLNFLPTTIQPTATLPAPVETNSSDSLSDADTELMKYQEFKAKRTLTNLENTKELHDLNKQEEQKINELMTIEKFYLNHNSKENFVNREHFESWLEDEAKGISYPKNFSFLQKLEFALAMFNN